MARGISTAGLLIVGAIGTAVFVEIRTVLAMFGHDVGWQPVAGAWVVFCLVLAIIAFVGWDGGESD